MSKKPSNKIGIRLSQKTRNKIPKKRKIIKPKVKNEIIINKRIIDDEFDEPVTRRNNRIEVRDPMIDLFLKNERDKLIKHPDRKYTFNDYLRNFQRHINVYSPNYQETDINEQKKRYIDIMLELFEDEEVNKLVSKNNNLFNYTLGVFTSDLNDFTNFHDIELKYFDVNKKDVQTIFHNIVEESGKFLQNARNIHEAEYQAFKSRAEVLLQQYEDYRYSDNPDPEDYFQVLADFGEFADKKYNNNINDNELKKLGLFKEYDNIYKKLDKAFEWLNNHNPDDFEGDTHSRSSKSSRSTKSSSKHSRVSDYANEQYDEFVLKRPKHRKQVDEENIIEFNATPINPRDKRAYQREKKKEDKIIDEEVNRAIAQYVPVQEEVFEGSIPDDYDHFDEELQDIRKTALDDDDEINKHVTRQRQILSKIDETKRQLKDTEKLITELNLYFNEHDEAPEGITNEQLADEYRNLLDKKGMLQDKIVQLQQEEKQREKQLSETRKRKPKEQILNDYKDYSFSESPVRKAAKMVADHNRRVAHEQLVARNKARETTEQKLRERANKKGQGFNPDILIDGILDEHLQGSGILDSLKNFGRKALNVITNSYSPTVERAIKNYGNWNIKQVFIGRTPVQKLLTKLLNAISLGDFGKYMYTYDQLYHLFVILKIQDGKNGPIKYYRTEKRPNITWQEVGGLEDKEAGTNYIKGIPSNNQTVNEMFEGAMKTLGKGFHIYDPVKFNCQSYIKALMNAIGITNANDFIEQSITTLTGIAYKVAQATTSLGHFIGRLQGKGKKKLKRKRSRHVHFNI